MATGLLGLSLIHILPLPPYIKEELQDQERYQTVYSREVGSAAAPTAFQHFQKNSFVPEFHLSLIHI